jgi:hypothetical protein
VLGRGWNPKRNQPFVLCLHWDGLDSFEPLERGQTDRKLAGHVNCERRK